MDAEGYTEVKKVKTVTVEVDLLEAVTDLQDPEIIKFVTDIGIYTETYKYDVDIAKAELDVLIDKFDEVYWNYSDDSDEVAKQDFKELADKCEKFLDMYNRKKEEND